MTRFELAIIIPCFNEYGRIRIEEYEEFLRTHETVCLCFVNDCSTDKTINILKSLEKSFQNQVELLSNKTNEGKASSVRNGMLHLELQHKSENYAYLDADLAVSLEECYSYLSYLLEPVSFVFASRILKIGSTVERKFSRFLIGRTIATIISNILNLHVYDTQCGCKVFKKKLVPILFKRPFISKWLFDVELFSRLLCVYKKEAALKIMEEIPVKKWVDQGDSKVKLAYFFRLWYDLYLIRKEHRKNYSFQESQD